MEKFLNEGITYNADDFYVHANTADFEEEVINKISEPTNGGGEVLTERVLTESLFLKKWRKGPNIKRRSPMPPALYPSNKKFSHVYHRHREEEELSEGAARLDRAYSWGKILCNQAVYFPAAFSDHFGLQVDISLPAKAPAVVPNFRPYFKGYCHR